MLTTSHVFIASSVHSNKQNSKLLSFGSFCNLSKYARETTEKQRLVTSLHPSNFKRSVMPRNQALSMFLTKSKSTSYGPASASATMSAPGIASSHSKLTTQITTKKIGPEMSNFDCPQTSKLRLSSNEFRHRPSYRQVLCDALGQQFPLPP